MNSHYDNILIKYAEGRKINYTVISDLSNYVEYMNNHLPFMGERIDFSKLNNTRFVESDQGNISFDAIIFIKSLVDDRICWENDAVIYIGDSLTNNGYEFDLNDLLKIIPFIVTEIPQHHYLLFKDLKKIILISFENVMEFGTIK
ncbi:hypothetical protein ED375_09355 [Muribaculaceae bacterium Isolate-004 (NCI)]|nr:hypothetical protein ED375_09355 [Muribaculaceae bacterium Isolate-004 (NCI)]